MTIHLPKELESSVRAEVLGGRFASEDDMVAAAVREYLARPRAEESTDTGASGGPKPIWETIEEENRTIPPDVWDALPPDLAEQHDHYLYGTPKRPAS